MTIVGITGHSTITPSTTALVRARMRDVLAHHVRDGRRALTGDLLRQAAAVHTMPFPTSGPEAYFAASKDLVRRCDTLIAVWDGGPPDGRGGTADAVDFARRVGRDVIVVWPIGAERG